MRSGIDIDRYTLSICSYYSLAASCVPDAALALMTSSSLYVLRIHRRHTFIQLPNVDAPIDLDHTDDLDVDSL